MYTKYMKNSFAKISRNLAGYRYENNFAGNNSVECINIFDNVAKYFNILQQVCTSHIIILIVQTKLFFYLYDCRVFDFSNRILLSSYNL